MKDISINIKTIKRHAKRLHKILKADGFVTEDFKLAEAQEIFAKSLGCNNWAELQNMFLKDLPMVELKLTEQEKVVYAITDHLNLNRGNVGKKFWYMLMNAHQIMGASESLDKVVNAFSHKFNEDVHPNEVNLDNWTELEQELKADPEFVDLLVNYVPPKKVVARDYKPTIVVVDNSSTILKAIRFFLNADFEIILFENSSGALEYIHTNVPELIICDIDVPSLTDTEDNSGYRFINGLDDKLKDIPVVFISHKVLTVSLEENHEFLPKPFGKSDLIERVNYLLN
jgi:CheY-like chemotaxis protein